MRLDNVLQLCKNKSSSVLFNIIYIFILFITYVIHWTIWKLKATSYKLYYTTLQTNYIVTCLSFIMDNLRVKGKTTHVWDENTKEHGSCQSVHVLSAVYIKT